MGAGDGWKQPGLSHVACRRSKANIVEKTRIKDRILAGSHLLKEESGLELWNTPKGQFWIPKGNRYVLPFNLAEMEQHIYGAGEHFIHSGDIVLDCGASDGDFTRQALEAGAQTVVAIEISPSSAECIRRNLASETAAGRVIVYPKGVWNKDDTLTLNVDDTNFAANSVVMHSDSSHPSVMVPLTTIDKLVAELRLPRVDFIKMDIEGAEVPALAGGHETIARFKPRLVDRHRTQARRRVHDPRMPCGRFVAIIRWSAGRAWRQTATYGQTCFISGSGFTNRRTSLLLPALQRVRWARAWLPAAGFNRT